MDDREWMYRRMRNGRMNPEYITGVRRFINFAYSIGRNVSLGKIRCPCVKCRNQKFQKEDDVSYHLLRKGFLPYYKNWTVHGEPYDKDNMVGPSSGGISRDEREFDESREGSNMRCSDDPNCLHSIHGSSCSRTSVSIKRKSFDTAIDPVSGKKELSLYGTSEFNNASCGREIGIILRTNFKGPWHSWDKVDAMCKDELFKEFKKKYAFLEEDEAIVRKIWEDRSRTCLNQQLARARNKAMSIIGTKNIIDCLDKGPVWIQNEDWNTMINDVWSTDRFCKRSKTSKQNRLKQTDGKISTHSGGSVSFASYRASMQEQAGGKELPWVEVFSALHQKSNETGTFVDNRSKIVVEKYTNEMVARYGPDQDNHPSFDGAAWCEASGGVSKGRVYGAPRMPKSKVDVSSSSHTYSVNSSYPSTTTTRRYEEQLQQNCEAIDDMRNEMSSIKDYLKLLVGHMGLSMSTPMAPSMPSPVAPSMPSPLAPSMPSPVAPSMPSPTMAPGHRPRPRPQMPYNGPSSSHQQHRRSFPP